MSRHFIPLATAKGMTKKYRDEKKKVMKDEYKDKNIFPNCETFEREAFDAVLALPGCTGLRIYLGMNDGLEASFIIVGVDAQGQDILTPFDNNTILMKDSSMEISEAHLINDPVIENGTRCPVDCPTNLL